MTARRWALRQVRATIYAPVDALVWLDLAIPRWLLRGLVVVDSRIVAALIPERGRKSGH